MTYFSDIITRFLFLTNQSMRMQSWIDSWVGERDGEAYTQGSHTPEGDLSSYLSTYLPASATEVCMFTGGSEREGH